MIPQALIHAIFFVLLLEVRKMSENDFQITEGNIFADLGLEDAEEMLTRSDLMSEVASLIKKNGLSQKGIADILNISQTQAIALLSNKITDFSTELLKEFLKRLMS